MNRIVAPAITASKSATRSSAGRMIVSVVLLSVLLASCALKTTYRFVDWWVAWSVDDYVQWDKPQQRRFDQRLDTLLLWHQRSQLVEYGEFLTNVKQDVRTPLTIEQLHHYQRQLAIFWQQIVRRIEPDVVDLLASLSDSQLAEVTANLQAKQAEYEQKYRPDKAAKLQRQRIKETRKTIRKLIGNLTPQQQSLIADWHAQRGYSATLWLKNRKIWTDQFITALSRRGEQPFTADIHRLFATPELHWDDEYARLVESNQASLMELIIALQSSLTAGQRRRLESEIDKWITLCHELASEVTPVQGQSLPRSANAN